MTDTQKETILTEGTPINGVTKKLQILLRRKPASIWEQVNTPIPEGEPCFAYDSETGDHILKIGAKDLDGNLQTWNALKMLLSRVDDGELN